MSKQKQPEKSSVSLPQGNQTQRIIVFAGIIAVVIIFVAFILMIAGRGGEDKAQYTGLVQQQSELVRIAAIGASDPSVNADLKATATNLNIVVSSDKQQIAAALTKKNIKLKGKELNGVPNPETTQLLNQARAAANFDSTLITTLSEQLDDYRATLEKTYNQTRSRTIKTSLSNAYKHTNLLQKQLEATKP